MFELLHHPGIEVKMDGWMLILELPHHTFFKKPGDTVTISGPYGEFL